ncbi:MAG: hypothetical protein SFU83_18880 [Meiothermus sp.]|nr:hypothetical protein [Meiothermus sp.]
MGGLAEGWGAGFGGVGMALAWGLEAACARVALGAVALKADGVLGLSAWAGFAGGLGAG